MYNLMILGTGSNVGKSLISTAICRIINNEGYDVCPFKSQNMALNSFVTKDGKEMGRAQVTQAEGARIEPDVRMNPILLKPNSDLGSQVILLGEVFGNYKARDYYKVKDHFKKSVLTAYEELSSLHKYMIIEGAGSAAEINLRKNDLVNMGLAHLIKAPVILVGDIDRGGVFASIYGTYNILSEDDRKYIKGYIINKFRGDPTLLDPAIEQLNELTGLKCFGVVPVGDFNIDEEDSLAKELEEKKIGEINVGVIKLKHISNFTDFNPIKLHKEVNLTYIQDANEIEKMDLVIIPGSKNTISDLKFLKQTNMDLEIIKHFRKNKPIIGICGGYQMLGEKVYDEHSVESDYGYESGLGILPMITKMEKIKELSQSTGKLATDYLSLKKGSTLTGYEIHMGKSEFYKDINSFIEKENGQKEGAIYKNVIGTYFHGIFENDDFRNAIISLISNEVDTSSFINAKDREYEKLAEHVKKHLDMSSIMELLNNGV